VGMAQQEEPGDSEDIILTSSVLIPGLKYWSMLARYCHGRNWTKWT
jgi:hypothetical protein